MSMDMDIHLEKPVLGNDGEQIGTVDRLIIDRETHKVREFMVKEGTILTTDRIVDVDLVQNIDDDGTVHLSMPASEADSLPPFVETQYTEPTDQEMDTMPPVWAAGGAGGGPLFWAPAGPGRADPAGGSMFEPAPLDHSPAEPERPVDQQSVVIDEGTNVVASDGEAVGTVEEIRYDDAGEISGFRVTSGMLFTKKIDVPIRWVDDIRPDAVQLNMDAQKVESEGAVEE